MRTRKRDSMPAGRRTLRCAVYARKSSDEGLEQEFNSLDAQREACEAFIRSQKQEGWICLTDAYDDGGISGATMDRPALQRLLTDIKMDKVDVVVVYKVDRLTRSLSDFARMVEIFDARGVSFVSVTQQFNTTTSMGRLTLNVLLSFAQFEREVTGERIRDKIAASKKKGMWMGGTVPLGYDAKDRKLVVNEAEAETVRMIFRRYVELGSVHILKAELDGSGIVSKVRICANGRRFGGNPMARGALYAMLQNPIYRGEIRHKNARYPGQHAAIIDPAQWAKVQERLANNTVARRHGSHSGSASLLAGLLFDDQGHRMIPTHSRKGDRRYRYYVSKPLITQDQGKGPRGRRMPAADIERIVVNRLRQFLSNSGEVYDAIEASLDNPADRNALIERAGKLASTWTDIPRTRVRAILLALVLRVDVHAERINIYVLPSRLAETLRGKHVQLSPTSETADRDHALTLSVPARLKRVGMDVRFILDRHDPYDAQAKPDRTLIRLLVKANELREKLVHNGGQCLDVLAAREGITGSYFTRVVRLGWLAPDIVKAVLDGRQPISLTTAKLLRESRRLPRDWVTQRRMLEFE